MPGVDGFGRGDEDPLLIMVDPVEDRHPGEPSGSQRHPDRLFEHLAADDAGIAEPDGPPGCDASAGWAGTTAW
jgi:hypothetical protein